MERYENEQERNNRNGSNRNVGSTIGLLAVGAAIGAGIYWLTSWFAKQEEEELKAKQNQKEFRPVDTRGYDPESDPNIDRNTALICPISLQMMTYPVIIECGHTFDFESIKDFFKKDDHCPVCRVKVNRQKVSPNWALRHVIEKEMKKNREENN